MYRIHKLFFFILFLIPFTTCNRSNFTDPGAEIDYCINKAKETLDMGFTENLMPRTIKDGQSEWSMTRASNWTASYWTGILWLLSQYTEDQFWTNQAMKHTEMLLPDKNTFFNRQDFGLSVMLSIGYGYDQTKNLRYKDILLKSANMYHDFSSSQPDVFPLNNYIFESDHDQQYFNHSLLNLSLLFKASKKGMPNLLNHAQQKAFEISGILNKRLQLEHNTSQFNNGTQYSAPISRINHGIRNNIHRNDLEILSRKNIAWLMYGFITAYHESNENQFWEDACNLAKFYIQNYSKVHKNEIQYGNKPKTESIEDLATSAIAASALLKISITQQKENFSPDFYLTATDIIKELASPTYKSYNKNKAFLMFDTKDSMSSKDVSLIYADYYYLEALIELHKHNQKRNNL